MPWEQLVPTQMRSDGVQEFAEVIVTVGLKSKRSAAWKFQDDPKADIAGSMRYWEWAGTELVMGQKILAKLGAKPQVQGGGFYWKILNATNVDETPLEAQPQQPQRAAEAPSGQYDYNGNYSAAFDPAFMLQNIAKCTADIAIAAANVARIDQALADPDALEIAIGAIKIAQGETDRVKEYLLANWQPPPTPNAGAEDWGEGGADDGPPPLEEPREPEEELEW